MKLAIPIALLVVSVSVTSGCTRSPSNDKAGRVAGERARNGGPGARVDVSTDESVVRAYQELTGSTFVPEVFRPEGLDGIVMVNAVIPDDGTDQLGVFVDGEFFPPGEDIRPSLLHLGWQEAGPEERVAIARNWLEKSHRFGSVVAKPIETPSGYEEGVKISPPVFSLTEDGGVSCDFWTVTGWSIAGRPMYAHRTVVLGPDANLAQ